MTQTAPTVSPVERTTIGGRIRRVRPSGQRLATLAMIGSAACWGSATVMSSDLLGSFTSSGLLVVQLTASVLVLVLVALIWEGPRRFVSRGLAIASLVGLLEPGLTYTLDLAGLAMTTAGNASVISASEPVLTVVLAWLLLRQRPSRRMTVAIVISAVGLVLVSGSGLTGWSNPLSAIGDALVLAATASAALYSIVTYRFSSDFSPATLAAGQQIVGLAFAIVVLLLVEGTGIDHQDWAAITPAGYGYAALSGVVQYALAFWLYLVALRRLRPAVAAVWLALTPVLGIAGGALFLGEIPGPLMLLGTIPVLGALVLARNES